MLFGVGQIGAYATSRPLERWSGVKLVLRDINGETQLILVLRVLECREGYGHVFFADTQDTRHPDYGRDNSAVPIDDQIRHGAYLVTRTVVDIVPVIGPDGQGVAGYGPEICDAIAGVAGHV